MSIQLTQDIVDLLVPTHTVLRYKEEVVCTDENRLGGFSYDFADKEWRCKRCCLLDLLDGFAPDGVTFSLQVYGYGNIR